MSLLFYIARVCSNFCITFLADVKLAGTYYKGAVPLSLTIFHSKFKIDHARIPGYDIITKFYTWQQSCRGRCEIFVVITALWFEWEQDVICIEFKLRLKNHQWHGPKDIETGKSVVHGK